MIYGLGTDIVQISRFEKLKVSEEKFAQRVLTNFELKEWRQAQDKKRYLAKKFASKEAIVKALGTGIGNGVSWKMMQIEHDAKGKPVVVALDALNEMFVKLDVKACHLSIADELDYAAATAIIEI